MFNLIPWRRRSPEAHRGDIVEREVHPLARFRDEFENLMERFWSEIPNWPGVFSGHGGSEWSDEESQYVLRAEVPGFEPGDFDVQVRGNQVVIRAERKQEEKGAQGTRQHHPFNGDVDDPRALAKDATHGAQGQGGGRRQGGLNHARQVQAGAGGEPYQERERGEKDRTPHQEGAQRAKAAV